MKKLVALALLAGSLSAQADESVDVQTGREQIERIIGNAAIADFCEVDSETCIQLTPAALESCW